MSEVEVRKSLGILVGILPWHANVGCLDDENASSKEKLVVKEV